MYKAAVQALKSGQRLRAKDLLTRLLKVDQSNADYWLWMSAAVDSEKEQVYCLQNVLKLDPNSIPARRGLVVLGALRPEDAGLPPAHILEDLPVVLPELSPQGGLGRLLGKRRNIELAAIGGLSALAFVVLTVACLAVFRLGPFRPARNVVVVTSTPAPTRPPPATAETVVVTSGPCLLPSNPNPATPLAAYLCLQQTPTPGPVPTEPSLSEDYTSLKNAYRDGLWDRVIERGTIVAADPTLAQSPRVYFYIAEAYRHTGRGEEALRHYGLALQKDAGFAAAFWGKALVELGQNSRTQAMADFDRALASDPAFVPAYLDRAAYLAATGNITGTIADLEQARLLAPTNALVQASLALAYVEAGNPRTGQSAAEVALELDPGLALAYFARGRAALALGQAEDAEGDLSLAYRYVLDLPHPLPAQWQASVLAATAAGQTAVGNDTTALPLYTRALGLYDRDPAIWLARGQLYLRGARFELARSDFGAAIALFDRSMPASPARVDAYLGLGEAQLGLERPAEALAAYQAALRLAPESFTALLGLGRAQLGAGRVDDAIATLSAAVESAETSTEASQAYSWRARAYQAADRPADEAADLAAIEAVRNVDEALAGTAAARLTEIGPLPAATAPASPTRTASASPAATVTRTATVTPRPTATRTLTPTAAPTATIVATRTPIQTASATTTRTATVTRTATTRP
ncbi:MAG: tetratricopeptide repeat protein [Anaerolineales bacterium]|nr:tetratricopeptide repeat protein [Anaerolineales bacterium]